MRTIRLPNPELVFTLALAVITVTGCGRKGDPIPRPRSAARPCQVQWLDLRRLEVILPTQDATEAGNELVGIQSVRLVYLPLGAGRPSAQDVLLRGEVVLERSRPDLPRPGGTIVLDLKDMGRSSGWLVVVAVRVGNVVGRPSEVIPWLHPAVK